MRKKVTPLPVFSHIRSFTSRVVSQISRLVFWLWSLSSTGNEVERSLHWWNRRNNRGLMTVISLLLLSASLTQTYGEWGQISWLLDVVPKRRMTISCSRASRRRGFCWLPRRHIQELLHSFLPALISRRIVISQGLPGTIHLHPSISSILAIKKSDPRDRFGV